MENLLTYSNKLILEQSEGDLVAEAKKDPGKFEPLYNRYFKQIFLFIFYRVKDKDTAADITSQVFLNALSNLDKYTYKGLPLSSWLYRIAINECNVHFRNRGQRQYILLDQVNYLILAEEMNLFDDTDTAQLKKALLRLKPGELQAVELRFFESLSFNEVGQVLGISGNNAKVRVYRAIDKLRKWIKRS